MPARAKPPGAVEGPAGWLLPSWAVREAGFLQLTDPSLKSGREPDPDPEIEARLDFETARRHDGWSPARQTEQRRLNAQARQGWEEKAKTESGEWRKREGGQSGPREGEGGEP